MLSNRRMKCATRMKSYYFPVTSNWWCSEIRPCLGGTGQKLPSLGIWDKSINDEGLWRTNTA
jgi:hypothetical protein